MLKIAMQFLVNRGLLIPRHCEALCNKAKQSICKTPRHPEQHAAASIVSSGSPVVSDAVSDARLCEQNVVLRGNPYYTKRHR